MSVGGSKIEISSGLYGIGGKKMAIGGVKIGPGGRKFSIGGTQIGVNGRKLAVAGMAHGDEVRNRIDGSSKQDAEKWTMNLIETINGRKKGKINLSSPIF